MCRVSEPVLAAKAPSKVQTNVKKVKQRLAKLQRRQWADGMVSFAAKVRLPIPNIGGLCAVCCCKLCSDLRGVGAAACNAKAEQQCKDAAECCSIEVAQGHSRRSPDCQVCLTTCCTGNSHLPYNRYASQPVMHDKLWRKRKSPTSHLLYIPIDICTCLFTNAMELSRLSLTMVHPFMYQMTRLHRH